MSKVLGPFHSLVAVMCALLHQPHPKVGVYLYTQSVFEDDLQYLGEKKSPVPTSGSIEKDITSYTAPKFYNT